MCVTVIMTNLLKFQKRPFRLNSSLIKWCNILKWIAFLTNCMVTNRFVWKDWNLFLGLVPFQRNWLFDNSINSSTIVSFSLHSNNQHVSVWKCCAILIKFWEMWISQFWILQITYWCAYYYVHFIDFILHSKSFM